MMSIDLRSAANETIMHQSRPVHLIYKSQLRRYMTTMCQISFLLLDFNLELQTIRVPLIEGHIDRAVSKV